jgi:DNA-binding transcriptional ArsR family regulator
MLDSLDRLDSLFQALSEPARRAILQRLSHGTASVSELAGPLDLSLAAVVQHIQRLEDCGMIKTTKTGRVRHCELNISTLRQAESWLSERRTQWDAHIARLGTLQDDGTTDN